MNDKPLDCMGVAGNVGKHDYVANDTLTDEQLRRIIANHESGVQLTGINVYHQLLETNAELAAAKADIEMLTTSRQEYMVKVEKAAAMLRLTIELYGKPGGPWNIPSDPGGWITQARETLAELE